jgi:hypothetical protein
MTRTACSKGRAARLVWVCHCRSMCRGGESVASGAAAVIWGSASDGCCLANVSLGSRAVILTLSKSRRLFLQKETQGETCEIVVMGQLQTHAQVRLPEVEETG